MGFVKQSELGKQCVIHTYLVRHPHLLNGFSRNAWVPSIKT